MGTIPKTRIGFFGCLVVSIRSRGGCGARFSSPGNCRRINKLTWNREHYMGKLKRVFCAALVVAALLAHSQQAKAAGDCVFYYVPQPIFFQAGGSIVVVPKTGNSYVIDASSVSDGTLKKLYSLPAGAEVIVYPPTCGTWYWGWTYFGVCNNQGSLTFGPEQPRLTTGVRWIHLTVYIDCDCPNGTSDAGLRYDSSRKCEASPAPQP